MLGAKGGRTRSRVGDSSRTRHWRPYTTRGTARVFTGSTAFSTHESSLPTARILPASPVESHSYLHSRAA